MRSSTLLLCLASLTVLAAPAARADSPVQACPSGQAVQSLQPGGKVATCIDVDGRLDAEAMARMQGDQAVRDAINETSIVGRYAFTGTRTCLANLNGFDSNGNPLPPQSPFAQWSMMRGFYTFNADGTGTGTADVETVTLGRVSFTTVSGDIEWSIVGEKLTVMGDLGNSTFTTEDRAPLTAYLGKDVKVFTLAQEGIHVETLVTHPSETRTPRICTRNSVLTKMAE
jgi:hypothetical protein